MTDNPSISARHDAALEGIAAAGREIAEAVASLRPQIAASVPAEQTQTGSGDSGTSETLGDRLRALVTLADPTATHESVDVRALMELAAAADRLDPSRICNGQGDHSWVDTTTVGDRMRRVTVQQCIHCPAVLEERA